MTRASSNGDSDISLFLPVSWRVELWGMLSLARPALVILVLIAVVLLCPPPASAAESLTITQAAGGIPFVGVNPASSQFGAMNALGVGGTATGVSVIPLSNGALYYTPYQLIATVNGNHTIHVTAVLKTNFVHPAALILENCPSSSACNTSGAFSAMSTTTPVTVVPSTPTNLLPVTATAGLGILVPDNDGASAFTGTDSASITLTLLDENNNKVATAEIDLNFPTGETVQTAVQLTLGTATGGLTVSPSSDYAANYGNVNGLGIGPGSGLTTVAAPGGTIYSTPYLINPAFSDFSSTTATISVTLTSNFAHPSALWLEDSASSSGPYTQITSTPLQITTSGADRGSITRYLGLFVSSSNGAGTFTGTDNATLTFTLTVP
jgi:hypothetical protein